MGGLVWLSLTPIFPIIRFLADVSENCWNGMNPDTGLPSSLGGQSIISVSVSVTAEQ